MPSKCVSDAPPRPHSIFDTCRGMRPKCGHVEESVVVGVPPVFVLTADGLSTRSVDRSVLFRNHVGPAVGAEGGGALQAVYERLEREVRFTLCDDAVGSRSHSRSAIIPG